MVDMRTDDQLLAILDLIDHLGLVMLRRNQNLDHDLIRRLVAEIRVRADEGEPEVLDRLSKADDHTWPFQLTYRLQNLLGYERDEQYRLVRKADA